MIEYANESVIKLLKKYDMLAKSLKYITDLSQRKDISDQMTKLIIQVINVTNVIYESKYKKIATRAVYLMDDEKNRLLELINLVNERRAYVNNQLKCNQELTGMMFEIPPILGENKLEDYKRNVKTIDRYKNNIRLEAVLEDEIQTLEKSIKKAQEKISNNKNINRQLEDKMIRIVTAALEKLSLYELKEREKEINLAYTELGYSLEKAKENAKIARRDCTEEIILECDNILASTTLDYERYKEKKSILRLIDLYKKPVASYEDIMEKREEINDILLGITNSELYGLIGNELNKEYSTLKLEAQDIATLKNLTEEKENKEEQQRNAREENNSESLKGLLATLLENEKKYQAHLEEERRKKEQEILERKKLEEQRKLEELARKQKELEEERNKEIERRTKELLNEKKNSLINQKNQQPESTLKKKNITTEIKKDKKVTNSTPNTNPSQTIKKQTSVINKNQTIKQNQSIKQEAKPITKNSTPNVNKPTPSPSIAFPKADDFFAKEQKNTKVVNQGIPVIKNNNVTTAKKVDNNPSGLFPEIPIEKKKDIFPTISKREENDSFFDENEFNDLNNYMENKNENWF